MVESKTLVFLVVAKTCQVVEELAHWPLPPDPNTSLKTEAGVLDEPYLAKPAQRSIHTGLPGFLGWTRFKPNVDWRACTGTPLSGVS